MKNNNKKKIVLWYGFCANSFQKVNVKVNANQQKILAYLKSNPYATMEELSETIGITKKNIFNNMKRLQENGLLRRVGADKNGWWEVAEQQRLLFLSYYIFLLLSYPFVIFFMVAGSGDRLFIL